MANPAWATELDEEWVETSPSPPHQPIDLPEAIESLVPITVDSIRAKRGSLRALGHAAPRGLPPSRSASEKIVSGHGTGRVLSERSHNVPSDQVLSPPLSRSSSGAIEAVGTFVVKEGVEDDRGKGLAMARKGRDMFGPSALEKMFQPPSPPKATQPPAESSEDRSAAKEENRRASHAYAPTNPSRLSKSVTPSTASSLTMSEVPTGQGEGDSLAEEDTVVREDESGPPQQEFSFVYPAPGEIASGSTTLRGGSTRNKPPFEPSLVPLDGEPSHSTLLHRSRRQTRKTSSPRAGLRLFRSTYDTYTREHLSAIVDSIAIEPSPSPPIPTARDLRDWSPSASPSEGSSGDMRSPKRMRMSPISPARTGEVRDWGAQGRAMLDRIRGRPVDSTTSESWSVEHDDERVERPGARDWGAQGRAMLDRIRGRPIESTTSEDFQEDDGPTIDYPAIPPSPPLDENDDCPSSDFPRESHRSNKSTTSSSYLREAEQVMAKIKARGAMTPHDSGEVPPLTDASSDWESRVRGKGRTGPSPRRMLRRLSASEEVKRAAEHSSGDDAPKPLVNGITRPSSATSGAPLPPPRQGVNADDLARFVSSTTFPTSTTLSTSFVKHAGRPAPRVRVIRPDDVEGLVQGKLGKMRYDQASMRWVRELGQVDEAGESRVGGSEESEDVFAGMESLGEPVPTEDMEGESPDDEVRQGDAIRIEQHSDSSSEAEGSVRPKSPPKRPIPIHAASAPAILTPAPAGGSLRPIRSALRNANSATPAGGPKKRAGWHESVTPAGASESKRSVSFSDGKKAGKIGDLFDDREKSWMPSARTRRIDGMLGDMEELTLDDGTPSKPPRPILLAPSASTDKSHEITVRPSRKRSAADATFLTECSFGVTHDRLGHLITDVYGSEPWWDHLTSLDLRGKAVDSVARLKEFLPELDEVILDDNKVTYLSGIPSGVRTLHVAGNRLSSLTSVDHLRNLQYLNISRNQLDSVSQLECLRHLRELKADGNRISELGGIGEMDCLIKLSVAGNRIERLDLGSVKCERQKLESLNLANNQLSSISSLHRLPAVTSISLDGNALEHLDVSRPMSNVRFLRLSDNDLSSLDLSRFPRLRTLYADGNRLTGLEHSSGRLENLSLRSQRAPGLRLEVRVLENVKRLYISGNPLDADLFPTKPLYSLVYLEAAACKLSVLPTCLANKMPNLKILNINYNFLDKLDGLNGLSRLRKMTVVGNRLGGSGATGVVKGLKGLVGLEEIDLRMNPSTLGFYLPLLTSHQPELIPSPIRPQAFGNITTATIAPPVPSRSATIEWAGLDVSFRRALPDEWYSKRLVYRGLIMAACPKVRVMDGLRVEEGERRKAGRLLDAARKA